MLSAVVASRRPLESSARPLARLVFSINDGQRAALVDLVDLAAARLGEERRPVGHSDGPFTAPKPVFHDRHLRALGNDAGNPGRDRFRRGRRRCATTALGVRTMREQSTQRMTTGNFLITPPCNNRNVR